MNKNILAGISVLLLSTFACEPVFAIGWKEVLFVFILVAFLIGPPVYRFIRKIEKLYNQKDK
jgi:hypothetical protein